jgi:hypothetical protein
MSQLIILNNGSIDPTLVTSFITNDGTAIPQNNILNVLGGTGIETYADPDLSDNLYIKVQNSFTDQAQTIGAVTENIRVIPLPIVGTYTIEVRVAAFEPTEPAGAGFSINGVVRSDGVTATLVGDSDGFAHKDAAINSCNALIVVSGNTAIVQVVGVAGLTIEWGAFTVYVNIGV